MSESGEPPETIIYLSMCQHFVRVLERTLVGEGVVLCSNSTCTVPDSNTRIVYALSTNTMSSAWHEDNYPPPSVPCVNLPKTLPIVGVTVDSSFIVLDAFGFRFSFTDCVRATRAHLLLQSKTYWLLS